MDAIQYLVFQCLPPAIAASPSPAVAASPSCPSPPAVAASPSSPSPPAVAASPSCPSPPAVAASRRSSSPDGEDSTIPLVTATASVLSPIPPPAFFASATIPDPEADDWISALPDILRSNIVSRLPIRDALRTTVLSTGWRLTWQNTPLVLDDRHLLSYPEDVRVKVITRILLAHKGPFRSVSLSFCCFELRKNELKLWSRLLRAKGVQELVFVNHPMPIDLCLSSDVLCQSLKVLYVGFFRFPSTTGLPCHARVFPYLKELIICHSIMETRDLHHMLNCSPMLRTLGFVAGYTDPESVCISSKRKLRCLLFWLSVAKEISVDNVKFLERLILWQTRPPTSAVSAVMIKIAQAPNLRVLGYLEPVVHQLQIGGTVIQAGTMATACTVLPSVRILALKLSFNRQNQAKMVPAFLRCFPNIETLHVESDKSDEPTGKLNLLSWQKSGSIGCVEKHIKTIFFYEFRGDRSELAFLKFVAMNALSLEKMVISLSSDCIKNTEEIKIKIKDLCGGKWANQHAALFVTTFGISLSFHVAKNLSMNDPFHCVSTPKISKGHPILQS